MRKVLLFLSILLLYSCGFYSLKGSLPAHVKSISVSPVVNESPEFGVSENVGEQISSMLISENVLNVTGEDIADSRLNVYIKSVLDKPYTYSAGDTYEQVEEWRITIKANVVWYDMTKDEAFFDRVFTSWGAYGSGVDISTDNIDNDGDGLVDSEDDDEFGSPRESALEVAIRKLSEDIINEITSTW